jgi:hypothetical protein
MSALGIAFALLAIAPPSEEAATEAAPTEATDPPADDASEEATSQPGDLPAIDVAPTDAEAGDPESSLPTMGAGTDTKADSRARAPDLPTEIPPPPPPSGTALKKKAKRSWPDRPVKWRVDLGVAGGQMISFDADYYGFDHNRRLPGMHVDLRADGKLAGTRVFLGGIAAYDYAGATGSVHAGALTTEVDIHEPILGARLSIRVFDGLDPYVQATGGPSILLIKYDHPEDAHQDVVTGKVTGLAGVTAYLPKKWLPRRGSARATGGIDFGIGYRYRGQVRLKPGVEDGDDDIGTDGPDLGRISFRGLIWRLGLFIRFM